MITSKQVRQKYIDFWTDKIRNHAQIPNHSLVPNGDSTILFVNSGMFPLVPYLGGQPHPLGKRLVNFQRSLRTDSESIEEIGDNRHTLMFEMMGNWSLGDYFKESQLPWVMELYHEVFGLDINNLYVSVFAGDDSAPRDSESIAIWQQVFAKYGINAMVSDNPSDVQKNFDENGNLKDPKNVYKIFTFSAKKNWWQRGKAEGELGGPDSEIFYDLGKQAEAYIDPDLNINSDNGRFIEIGNSVFIQFKLDANLVWQPLPQKNVDFGGGFERLVMCLQNKSDIFETDIYAGLISEVEKISGKTYKQNGVEYELTKYFRIIADHVRVSSFIIADGIVPNNKDQGYILRRFIRRLVRFGIKLDLEQDFTATLAKVVIDSFSYAYPNLLENEATIIKVLSAEEVLFRSTLQKGIKELAKLAESIPGGEQLFNLYETYGFPIEMALEELKINIESEMGQSIMKDYNMAKQLHQSDSRQGAEQKFKGGLADQSEQVTKLHTAHHLLLAALQKIVNPDIKQKGSNITGERLRIDFNLDRKVEASELAQVEEWVNKQIKSSLPVNRVEMPLSEAKNIGAQMEFGQKYPDTVSIYFIGGTPQPDGTYSDFISAEFCGGPHVNNTSELGKDGKIFKIVKEESSSSGVRRIKASLV